MTPDFDVDAATERVQGILKSNGEGMPKRCPNWPCQLAEGHKGKCSSMADIQPPAAVQEAGDKTFMQTASTFLRGPGRAPRSDKGKPRPKPQPAPEPEHKAGGITGAQAQRIGQLTRGVFEAREGFAAAEDTLRNAEQLLDQYIDSLVIDSLAK